MVAAAISLDSEALAWFQWEKGRRPIQNWLQLKSRLLDRFGHTQDGTMCEQFLSLKQEGSVCDYLRAFEQLEMTLEDVPKHIQESTFINGLKPNIQAEVRIMKPEGLREVMKFTQRVEEINWCQQGSRGDPTEGGPLILTQPLASINLGQGPPVIVHSLWVGLQQPFSTQIPTSLLLPIIIQTGMGLIFLFEKPLPLSLYLPSHYLPYHHPTNPII